MAVNSATVSLIAMSAGPLRAKEVLVLVLAVLLLLGLWLKVRLDCVR